MNILISVIVPIYNVQPYLNRCIDSLLNQTHKNLDIILVNDGSTDCCGEICDEYVKKDTRVKVIHKKNGGLSSARNAGLKLATGDYIGFVDSDDYIENDMYENLIEACLSNKCQVSSILAERVDQHGNIKDSVVLNNNEMFMPVKEYLKDILLHIGSVSVCTKLFNKSILEGVLFDESKRNEDLLFMLEIIERISGIQNSNQIGYYYTIREGSISNQGFSKTIIDMVDNSIYTLNFVKEKHPNLSREAYRFLLFQHMVYILMIPRSEMNKRNNHYINTIKNIRKHYMSNIFNPYLKTREKLILAVMVINPSAIKKIREYKRWLANENFIRS